MKVNRERLGLIYSRQKQGAMHSDEEDFDPEVEDRVVAVRNPDNYSGERLTNKKAVWVEELSRWKKGLGNMSKPWVPRNELYFRF